MMMVTMIAAVATAIVVTLETLPVSSYYHALYIRQSTCLHRCSAELEYHFQSYWVMGVLPTSLHKESPFQVFPHKMGEVCNDVL